MGPHPAGQAAAAAAGSAPRRGGGRAPGCGHGPVRAVGAGAHPRLLRSLCRRAVQRRSRAAHPPQPPQFRRAAQALLSPHFRRYVLFFPVYRAEAGTWPGEGSGEQVGDGGAAARGCGWRGAASGCQDRALAAARLRTLSSSGRTTSLSRRDKLEPDTRESRLLFAVTRQDLAPTGHLR